MPLSDTGRTGLPVFSGIVMEEFLRELRGISGYKRYDEMRRNSPTIGALLSAIEYSISGTVEWGWNSELGEDDPRIEFLETSLSGMRQTWIQHLSECLTMLPFGFSPFAVWYRRVGDKIHWHKFVLLGQDTVQGWRMNGEGDIEGLTQSAPPVYTPEFIPINRMVLYRTRVERNNPEGRSILRNSWISYYFVKNLQNVEGVGAERDLAGLPKVTLPPAASTDESDTNSDAYKAAKMVRNVRNDEQAGVVLPDGWLFELLSSGGSKQFNVGDIIQRHKTDMLMSVLAQFLMLGSGGVGSFALSKDQTNFFTMLVNGVCDNIADTFTQGAARPLLRLNGFDDTGIKRTHTPAGDVDVLGLADALQKVGDKLTWRTADESWLRQTLKLPEASAEELQAEKDKRKAAMPIFNPTSKPEATATPHAQEVEEKQDEEKEKMRAEFYSALSKFNSLIDNA